MLIVMKQLGELVLGLLFFYRYCFQPAVTKIWYDCWYLSCHRAINLFDIKLVRTRCSESGIKCIIGTRVLLQFAEKSYFCLGLFSVNKQDYASICVQIKSFW